MPKNRVQCQRSMSLADFVTQYGTEHLPRYLAEFCWRFNHRFDLAGLLERLGAAAAATPPMPYRLVKLAEVHW